MAENMNQTKIAEALRELRTAIHKAILSLDNAQYALETALQQLDQDSSQSPSVVEPEPEASEIPESESEAPDTVEAEAQPSTPEEVSTTVAEPPVFQEPETEVTEPAEPVTEEPPEPSPTIIKPEQETPPQPPRSNAVSVPPRPPSPPPPPAVTVMKQSTPNIPNNPPASSSYSAGSTVVTNASRSSVNEILDNVYQLAINGSTGAILSSGLISARDAIQQIVSVSPVFHEISSYGRDLRMLAANPLTQAQIMDLKEHLEDWKRRLGK